MKQNVVMGGLVTLEKNKIMLKINKHLYRVFILLFTFIGNFSLSGQNTSTKLVDVDSCLMTLTNNKERQYSYYFLEGVRKKNNGNIDDAFMLFKHCLNLDSAKADAHFQLGSLYMNINKVDEGVDAFRKAVEIDSLNYWYNEAYFFSLYSSPEKNIDAISQLETMTKRFPDKATLQFQLLELYNQTQDYDNMIVCLTQLEEKLGKSEQLSMEKFKAYLMKGEENKAFDEVNDLVKTYPNDLRYQVLLADVYLNNGKNKQAYNQLKKVLNKDPDFPMAIYAIANYYSETNQMDKYKEKLEKIIGNPQADTDLKLNLLRQFIVKTEADSVQVIPIFDKAIYLNPSDDQIPMLYTQYLYSQKMEKEAKPILEHILLLDPTNTPSRLMLLGLAIKDDDYRSVIKLCEAGILASPNTLEFYYYLSIAYNQAEEYDKLLHTVNKALSVIDDSTPKELVSDLYAIKGDAYHALDDKAELYAAYDKALEYHSENYGVLNNYAYYLSVDKVNLDKAEEMSKKTVDSEPQNATFLDTYAWILFELGKYTQAKVYIDTALENGGDASGVVVEHAGDIYYKLGEKEKALELWQKADELGAGTKIKQKIKRKKYISE